MGWILFEAMLALAVMLVAAWWTFSGRSEPVDQHDDDGAPAVEPAKESTERR